ncbi:MAG TPA: oxidative damage protection protein [Marinobacterium sp.]|nr:oxidative damage protection protein [Marinobacterium sp.]
MSRTVFCKKFKEELEGLERAPYPGPLGQDIFDNVSKKAWEEWTDHQTMLINEKHLSMMDPASRKFLQEEMQKFLSGEEFAQAEGYVPPSK